jgi:RNA-directed DNA polymerase
VVVVKGTRTHAEVLKDEIASLLARELKLTLSPTKTLVTHIDDGFDFLGFRIKRKTRGGARQVYTFPNPKAFAAVKRAVKALTRHRTAPIPLWKLLFRINSILRGWTAYFRFAASKRTFAYLDYYTWWRVARWLRKRRKQPSWTKLRRRELKNWEIGERGVMLFRPSRVPVERYLYRGARIPSPWDPNALLRPSPARRSPINRQPTKVMESRMRGNVHVRFGGRGTETD